MRLIDADALSYEPLPKGERNYRTYNLDDAYDDGYNDAFVDVRNAPTVDAVPVWFIEQRIERLRKHADYEFEENGGYAGGSQYRQWELECLLDAWMKRKDEQ